MNDSFFSGSLPSTALGHMDGSTVAVVMVVVVSEDGLKSLAMVGSYLLAGDDGEPEPAPQQVLCCFFCLQDITTSANGHRRRWLWSLCNDYGRLN